MAENETTNAIAQKIAPKLEQGERILWCGKTESGTTNAERGQKPINFGLLAIFPIAAVIMLVPFVTQQGVGTSIVLGGLLFGVIIAVIVIVSLIRMLGGKQESYAITDRRFLLVSENGFFLRNVRLEKLYDLRYSDSGRQLGYVYAKVVRTAGTKDNVKTRFIQLRGIKQPAVVYGILKEAVVKASGNKPAGPVNGIRDLIG